MKTTKLLLGILVLVFALFTACGDDNNPAGGGGNGGGAFTVSVGGGTTPDYSWTVGNAFSLSVVRTSDPTTIVWGLASPGQNAIASPNTHGVTPTGLIPTSQTELTLTSGVTYRVSVSRLDGSTGFTEFTP